MPTPFPHLPHALRGTVDVIAVDAPCLADNPWGDPTVRDVHVYSPAGTPRSVPLPAVLLLPGFAGTGEGMLGRGLGDVPISARIDRLIHDGCAPFRAVMPDVMTRLGGSQFVDSPAIGNYLTFLTDAVVPGVAAQYACTGRWGAAGRSSGGFGAFNLACARPDLFRAIAFHAGDAGFDLCYLGDLPPALRGLRAVGLDRFIDTFWATQRPNSERFAAMNILAMSCAYAPAPGRTPVPAHLPFDLDTGAIDFDVFASWRRHDPVVRATQAEERDALRSLDLCFVDAGRHDEYNLQLGAQRLVSAMRAGGIEVEHEEFDGGHRGTAWRYDVSLPKLAAALSG